MSSLPKTVYTPAEYLDRERASGQRHEYYQGETFAMSGASRAHNLLTANTVIELGMQMRDRECEVYSSDMRVKVSPTGLYTYPDVVAVCGPPDLEDEHFDTLLNPQVILEVLSPSTAAYDRGEKFEQYRSLESLTDYVLIAQDRLHVEHFARQDDGRWLLTEHNTRTSTLPFATIGCDLPMAALYHKLDFEPEAPPGPLGTP